MKPADRTVTGQLLLSDFQTVYTALVVAQTAQAEAERSESMLMNDLASITSNSYLAPGALSATTEEQLTRNSLDAHIKKIQAQQIANLSATQINDIVIQAQKSYVGRTVLIAPLSPDNVPIDSVWFDKQHGYRSGQMKRAKHISGTIEEILLDKNTLVIRPSRTMRMLNHALQQYMAYIIDPTTLQPMVTITIS